MNLTSSAEVSTIKEDVSVPQMPPKKTTHQVTCQCSDRQTSCCWRRKGHTGSSCDRLCCRPPQGSEYAADSIRCNHITGLLHTAGNRQGSIRKCSWRTGPIALALQNVGFCFTSSGDSMSTDHRSPPPTTHTHTVWEQVRTLAAWGPDSRADQRDRIRMEDSGYRSLLHRGLLARNKQSGQQ